MFKLSPKILVLNSNEVRSRQVRILDKEDADCLLNADIIHDPLLAKWKGPHDFGRME